MDVQHSGEIWRDFPELVAEVVFADGITPDAAASDRVATFTAIARSRLADATESGMSAAADSTATVLIVAESMHEAG